MKKGLVVLVMFSMVTWGCIENSVAFEQITAKEAYEMAKKGEAVLIDVRTLEEAVWVGSPSLTPGGEPIAYLIPWKIWVGVDKKGKSVFVVNPDFDRVVQEMFPDKDQVLILMCRSGHRSSYAAERLESLGYTHVYEIDNPLKEKEKYPGGCGGFQGSSYKGKYNGYRGYPGRLSNSTEINVEVNIKDVNNSNDSVSWMDMGLPITQKIDVNKVILPDVAKIKVLP